MSDWEEFCDQMGWANDEHATDKLIDYIERKSSDRFSGRRNHEFTPSQKRAYAIKKAEERRLLSTPVGQYLVKRWGSHSLFNIQEREWDENGSSCKSIYVEIGKGFFYLTITKYNESSYCVEFCNITGKSTLCTKASGNRLTSALIEQAVTKNDEAVNYHNRNRYKK